MKGRSVPILITILILAVSLLASQSVTVAQGPEPTAHPDEREPVVADPARLDALVSSSFTYQGKLTFGGAPVNGYCDFLWDIYASATPGGPALASDSHTNHLVTAGLFTVEIAVPVTLMDGNARFVEVQVRCPAGGGFYTTLEPRQELLAAPYALGLRLPFAHTIVNPGASIFSVTNASTTADSHSFLGSSAGGDGVRGLSTGAVAADNGVYGETNSVAPSDAGVKGVSTSAAAGGYFTSSTGYGVYGSTSSVGGYAGYFSNPAATSGAALYADGDAKQALQADGFAKAGAFLECGTAVTDVHQYFNNVSSAAIKVSVGTRDGQCTVDFGFDVSQRYVSALPWSIGAPRFVTFDFGNTSNQLVFFRFDHDGTGKNGAIMIMIY